MSPRASRSATRAEPLRRTCGSVVSVALAAVALGCGPGSPADADEAPAASQRERVLGPFLSAYWQLPVSPQTPVPAGFAAAEASLDPAMCGACHPRQYEQWKTSLHAAAYSPGFAGQLIEGGLAHPAEIRSCQTCHAPLAEQQPYDAALRAESHFDPALRAQGLVCGGCHVRQQRRYGPPRRPDLPPVSGPLPHAGFEVREEFQQSRFCAPCHQFFDDAGVEGKPLENTYAEWRRSPQAAAGRSCQSCHMPDRAHLWRGIHDPEMVRSAVEVNLAAQALDGPVLRAALRVANRDVGHAFPTYVTPRVFLAIWQVDAGGAELVGTRLEAVIGREVDLGSDPMREIFDTRLLPGESVELAYALARHAAAVALVGRVTVDPDYHYRGVFASLLETLSDPRARELIALAHRRSRESSYVLAEFRRPL